MAVVYQVVAFLQLCAFVASSATSEEFKCFIVPPSKLAPNECTTSFTYIGENGETREYNRCVTHKEAPPFTQPEDDFDPDEVQSMIVAACILAVTHNIFSFGVRF